MKKKSDNWKSLLKSDPIDWLLEINNPSVRYFTLKDILSRAKGNPDLKDAHRNIMISGIVPAILAKQNENGSWGVPEDFYVRAKYKGTVWNIILLAELGADGNDERIRKTAEFILSISQDKQSGGFAYQGGYEGGYHSKVIPCLTGNMVFSLIRFGYIDDPRVQQGIEWISKYQRFDDEIETAPKGWPYDKFKNCYGKHTCHMGAVKALKALAEIPANKRTKAVKNTINQGAEYLLKHNVYKRSHDLSQVIKPFWLRFGFPLMWNTDAMEILGILIKLGYHDDRMRDAIELMISKQDEQSRWKMEKSYNNRLLVGFEKDGKPSKWLTLNALRVLKGLAQK
jgi:hypothetical protein